MGFVSHFESKLTNVPSSTWWIDTAANVHVSNSMQGFITIQTTNPSENFIFMGNKDKAPVEAIGTFRLILDSGYQLDLCQTLYVPSISRNLISVSVLDKFGYSFEVGNGNFSLFKNSSLIGSGILIDGLYKLHLKQNAEIQLTLHGKETKRKSSKNDSYFLWHKKTGSYIQ